MTVQRFDVRSDYQTPSASENSLVALPEAAGRPCTGQSTRLQWPGGGGISDDYPTVYTRTCVYVGCYRWDCQTKDWVHGTTLHCGCGFVVGDIRVKPATYFKLQELRKKFRVAPKLDRMPEHGALVPIRDMHQDGKIVFCLQFYGVKREDLAVIPGGAEPIIAALKRRGFDTRRYQATIWDL